MKTISWWFACWMLVTGLLVSSAELSGNEKSNEDEIKGLLERGMGLIDKGKSGEAMTPLQTALARADKELGPTHLTTARVLAYLALAHRNKGEYAKAEPLYKRCLEIRESKLGKNANLVATTLTNLSLVYERSGQHARADQVNQRLIECREGKWGKDHPRVADTLHTLALRYHRRGEHARARPLHERCLAIREAKLDKDHLDLAASLHNLAWLYRDMGEYARALPLYERSLAIKEAKRGKDHLDVAVTLGHLAILHSRKRDHAKAEPLFKRCLEIREAKLARDDLLLASTLDSLGRVYLATQQFVRAEVLFQRGLQIREGKRGKDHPDLVASLNNLAWLYEGMGQFAKAEPLFARALEIMEGKWGKDHLEAAFPLNNLANLYHSMRQYARAEPLYLRSLAIREAKLGKDHLDVASPLSNLAVLYSYMGQYSRAEPLQKRSLEIREAKLGKNDPAVASSLNNLAHLYHALGQTAQAESLMRRSLEIREARWGKDDLHVLDSVNSLAAMHESRDQTARAIQMFDRARQGSRRRLGHVLPAMSPREQATFLDATERWKASLALSLGLAHPTQPDLAARSATWLVNAKALSQEALSTQVLLARDSRNPSTAELASRLRALRTRLAQMSLATPDAGKESEHHRQLAVLSTQEQELSRQLALAGGSHTSTGWIELAAVRKTLSSDAVFIDICRFGVFDFKSGTKKPWKAARYVAWVTGAKGDVRIVDLGLASRIDAAVKKVRLTLEQSAKLITARGEPEAEKALRLSLEELSKGVLKPLLPHVGKAKRWIVSPDGNLWLIPWEILLLADGKYAVEKHTLSYVSSGRDLVSTARYKGELSHPLIVADPDFDLDAKTARTETARLLGKRGEETLRSISGALQLGGVKRLPSTLAEASAIDRTLTAYTKQKPRRLLNREALEGLVKAVAHPRVLVLSTHGFFLPMQQSKPDERVGIRETSLPPGWENPLLRCGLLLAGCNDAGKIADGNDGVLTGLEVVGMDLRGTELVVLSACETGLGDVQNGEGVAGLRQAFRLAGAEAVVSTLWQVPDRSSAQLMTLFFQNLAKGKDRASALREAQLNLIEQRRDDTASAHPFFWAAFTLTGR